ncbi:hypothetical protein [Methylobacterium sp.]|jgi:lipopolysaccharide biosynthesis regulator YciM|uniref:hypothetical protein n=1 Tax=Methylobacterium sp. TaxID=409 RepID=UPI00262AA5B5|nr:hypothetical protein [Methylobacterium sp.]MDB5647498.1 hypothetical protein [Methylobacterium sp.]
MTSLMFSVRSPDGAVLHRMEATKTGRGIRFTCTCAEGLEGMHCEHRIALLLGDASHLVETDHDAVATLAALVQGSPLLQAVHRLAHAEAAEAEARLDLERARQVIATILAG